MITLHTDMIVTVFADPISGFAPEGYATLKKRIREGDELDIERWYVVFHGERRKLERAINPRNCLTVINHPEFRSSDETQKKLAAQAKQYLETQVKDEKGKRYCWKKIKKLITRAYANDGYEHHVAINIVNFVVTNYQKEKNTKSPSP